MKLNKLINRLDTAANKTLGYFNARILDNGSFDDSVLDLACYFKVPMLLIAAGQTTAANKMLDYIALNYMTKQGDFYTDTNNKSIKPEYMEYWCYMNGWILRAAQQLARHDITQQGFQYLNNILSRNKQGFLTNNPELDNGVTDVLTAAHMGLLYLELNDLEKAIIAGDYLCHAMAIQRPLTEKFYLRYDDNLTAIKEFDPNNAAMYVVNVTLPDQLYFMLGYPIGFLVKLYEKTQQINYFQIATEYLNFVLSTEYVYQANTSHKVAWAASLVYLHDENPDYFSAVERIAQHFIQQQSDSGLWYEGDLITSYDQSAEIAYWFIDIIGCNYRNGTNLPL